MALQIADGRGFSLGCFVFGLNINSTITVWRVQFSPGGRGAKALKDRPSAVVLPA